MRKCAVCAWAHLLLIANFGIFVCHPDRQSFLLARSHRYRRDPRAVDKEEDMWFNAEDDDEEEACDDDDDEDECEAYHEDEEGADSPPSSGRQVATPASGAEVNQGLPFGYGSPQGSGQKHSSGGGGLIHHGGGGGGGLQQQSSVSSTTSGGYQAASGGALGSTTSPYDSPTSAFMDSPFFSGFSASGGGSGAKKSRHGVERKTLSK